MKVLIGVDPRRDLWSSAGRVAGASVGGRGPRSPNAHGQTTVAEIEGWFGIISGPTKNKKNRIIRLGSNTVEVLKAHKERQAEEIESARGYWKDPGLVFTTKIGTPLDASNLVSRHFKPLLKRTGLPMIRWHELRHGCGSFLLSQGISIKVVQEILGHSSLTVTMDVYSHVLPDLQEKAAAAMDNLLSENW